MSYEEAIDWTTQVLVRSHGKEPIGNYNPLIIGELFWELSSRYKELAEDHVDQVADMCKMFTATSLVDTCPKDVRTRLSALKINETLQSRKEKAVAELQRLLEDKQDFPSVYNHYYTDNVQNSRNAQLERGPTRSVDAATAHERLPGCHSNHSSAAFDVTLAINQFQTNVEHGIERCSCEEALDCLLSMYKAQQKTLVANVTAQVLERYMVRGLQKMFSPLDVNGLPDEDILKVASEPTSVSARGTSYWTGKVRCWRVETFSERLWDVSNGIVSFVPFDQIPAQVAVG